MWHWGLGLHSLRQFFYDSHFIMSSVDFQVWELYVYMLYWLLLRTSGSLALGRYFKRTVLWIVHPSGVDFPAGVFETCPKQYESTRLCLKTVAPSNTGQKWKWPMNNELLWHFNVHTTDSLWNIAVHKLLFRTSFPAYPPRPDSLMKSLITWYISAPLSHLRGHP